MEKGFISEERCKVIYRWNSEIGRENWDMNDVMRVLYPERVYDEGTNQKYVYNPFDRFKKIGIVECVNPDAKEEKLYKFTEKGHELFGDG